MIREDQKPGVDDKIPEILIDLVKHKITRELSVSVFFFHSLFF